MKILVSVAVAMFLVGCSSDSNDKSSSQSVADRTSEIKKEIVEKTKDVKDDVVDKSKEIKEEAAQKVEDVVEKAKEIKEEAAQKAQDVKDDVVEKAKEIKEEASQKVEDVKQALTQNKDAATLYNACGGCHGADGSKAALGKSQVIKGWDSKKIADALHGYKAGSYGGAMKGLMAGQVSKLSDEDIKILSEHISKF